MGAEAMVCAMRSSTTIRPTVLAVAAHPDDIEFYQAGTLLLLKDAGCEVHMWNVANGSLGSMNLPPEEIAEIRSEEARGAAMLAGGKWHPPLFGDLEIFYDKTSLARVSAVIRSIRPQIILTHSPADYMEDHQNVCRLVVSATFSRGIPHYISDPPQPPSQDSVAIYHAAPHGLTDGYRNVFRPHFLVNVSSVIERKKAMLFCHRSQSRWLEDSQGVSYVTGMLESARIMAARGECGEFAEGWCRHSHVGFSPADFDPLGEVLSPYTQELHPHTYAQAN